MLRIVVVLLTLCALSPGMHAQEQDVPPAQKADLISMNIEDLMKIIVTSASKKVESLAHAPAAIFVITGDDIRRGGFSSVPDALRMVPGLYVAQQSAHVWVVAARGFSSAFNNKMLVLIDGRLVYSPTFGGLWWDVQDPVLEDIDRIEVIGGPGGTLWGANAVNGVINIITKQAAKTQGALVATSAGVNEGYAARTRYGGKLGENFAYRIYGSSNDWLPTVNASGARNYDEWSISQGGARVDWNTSQKDSVTFDGQGYSGRVRDVVQVFSPASATAAQMDSSGVVHGGHALGRWKHAFNDRYLMDVLGYCDWSDRNNVLFAESRNLCDIEFQSYYSFTDRQSLTWGGSVMTTGENWNGTFTMGIVPAKQRVTTYGGFLQYDIALVPDKFRLIAGSKFEHNGYTGFEFQPQVRAVWTPGKQYTFWAAFSRAVRTPTRIENGLQYRVAQINSAPPPPTFLVYSGDPSVKSETLSASEFGYRYSRKEKFSLDATIYYNDYEHLIGLTAPEAAVIHPSPFYVNVPEYFVNVGGGQTHGLEVLLKYSPVRRWTLSTGITELRGTSAASASHPAVATSAKQQVNILSKLDLTRNINLDAAYYYYDAIPNALPPVNRIDVGVSTKPINGFTFSVWGRNLLRDRHREAIPQIFNGGGDSPVGRLQTYVGVESGPGKRYAVASKYLPNTDSKTSKTNGAKLVLRRPIWESSHAVSLH
jgi:iron complex outermembrane receptor protein